MPNANTAVSGAIVSNTTDVTVAGRCPNAYVKQKYPTTWQTTPSPNTAPSDRAFGIAREACISGAITSSAAALAVAEIVTSTRVSISLRILSVVIRYIAKHTDDPTASRSAADADRA